MPVEPILASTPPTLTLEGPLVVQTVAKHREQLLEHLPHAGACRLELGGVDACDTFGVQLLLSLRRSAEARGVAVSWLQVPACVREQFALVGVPGGEDAFFRS